MNDDIKSEIKKDIGDLAKTISLLSAKYKEEPLLNDAQKAFMDLSLHVGKALDIQMQ